MFLEVRSLSKSYREGSESAVSGISFEVKEGEIVALVGESGCGKTTLLRMIAGLVEPDEGKIFLQGEWVKGPAHKLVAGHDEIELVTQECELFEYLTVFDNVAHFIEIFDKEYRQERVMELLSLCRIAHYADRYPRELSGGQQQRLAIARALAKEPELLLLDEPFSHLDAHLKDALMNDLGEVIRQTGTTALMVTHDTKDALRLADKIVMMRNGNKIQQASPQIIYEKPADEYVASLFGEPNLLEQKILNKLNIESPKGKRACTRIEDWMISPLDEATIKGEVERCHYLGAYYELEVKVEKEHMVRVMSDSYMEKGAKTGLKVNASKIHWIH